MRLQVMMFYQDDPKKCTAAKMVKFGLAQNIRRIGGGLVLDPFSERTLLHVDRSRVNSIVGIDCSWKLADRMFSKKFGGTKRRLPPLLAGNPINYSKIGKLTTVEAISASLYLLGFEEQSMNILDKFVWGHTFYELNQNLLAEYVGAKTEHDIELIARDFGL